MVTRWRRALHLLLACCALLPLRSGAQETPAAAEAVQPEQGAVLVTLQTGLGDIRLGLAKDRAPVTVDNFLRYLDARRFDGIEFYRAVRITEDGQYGLLQGGLKANPAQLFPPIAHESPRATGLSHVDGAISMAREAPGTATADWFIVIGDLKSLDGKAEGEDSGYAVFGRVVEGMDVVRRILDQPRDPEKGEGAMKGQMLEPPVPILATRRVD
jgi:peptidyl-prolyl cis-trans isomerase A (cyclophilin A)